MNIPEYLHQEVIKLVPTSVVSDIACFVFYDYHPKDVINFDITICTKSGELREYFQRDLKSSLNISCVIKKPCELRILRNTNSDLFYLLTSNDELFIISSKEKLQIHKKLTNIDRYDIGDTSCSGQTSLKIIKKDDAVPILFNDNFEYLEDYEFIHSPVNNEESLPVLNELKRKLVEARYSNKCNEKTYAQYLNLHQKVSLMYNQSQQTFSNSSVFQDNVNCIEGVLKFKTHKPWVKVCNKKLILMFNVLLEGEKNIENIHILLDTKTTQSLTYSTKIFTKLPSPPYWHEPNITILDPGQEIVIAAVVDLNELENILRVKLNGSIAYTVLNSDGKECLVPFDDVIVPSMEMMGDEIDELSSDVIDEQTILAILASTEKTKLCFRHIEADNDPEISLPNLFCTYLQMDRVQNAANVIVYRKSPYHALNGTMLVFNGWNSDNGALVSVHTRTPEQVLVLLHHIYNSVPAKIIVTTPSYKIKSKTEDLSQYNEEIVPRKTELNYKEYATSMLYRSAKILEHLDTSMVKMNESKNPLVHSKVGTHIDLFAGGVETFKNFKDILLKEAEKGINSLVKEKSMDANSDVTRLEASEVVEKDIDTDSDVMFID